MAFLFKMKLINGPLGGREISLPAGTLLMGQGVEVDLCVPLEGEAAQVGLRVEEEGVFLPTSYPTCWVDGHPWDAGEGPLPFGKVVDIAGQAVIFGKIGEHIAFIAMPPRVLPSGTRWELQRLQSWGWWGAGIMMLLLGGIAGVAWQLQSGGGQHGAVDRTILQGWLEQQSSKPPYKELKFNWQHDGTLSLEGRCRDSRELRGLLETLRQNQIFVREKALCDDQLRSNVQYILNLYGYEQVSVHTTDQLGRIAILGAIQADERWRKVVDMLAVLPGLEGWSVANQNDEQVQGLLNQLRRREALKQLSVVRAKEAIIVSGELDQKQQRQLEVVLAEFCQKWASAPKVIYQNIRPEESQKELFPAAIISIGGSTRSPFVELANGVRLQVGARLPSGFQIVHIDGARGIDLARDGLLVHVPLNL